MVSTALIGLGRLSALAVGLEFVARILRKVSGLDVRCLFVPHIFVFFVHISPKLPCDAAEILLTLLRVSITPTLEHV